MISGINDVSIFNDVRLISSKVYSDARGYFAEIFRAENFPDVTFVQENKSLSHANVLRGMHYQVKTQQAKLVSVMVGSILDVVVDVRKASPTFGWVGAVYLTAGIVEQIFIPSGYAHGFLVLVDNTVVIYKVSTYYDAYNERCIHYNSLDINWPVELPILSFKDSMGTNFDDAEYL